MIPMYATSEEMDWPNNGYTHFAVLRLGNVTVLKEPFYFSGLVPTDEDIIEALAPSIEKAFQERS